MEPVLSPEDNNVPLNPLRLWQKLADLRDPRTVDWLIVREPKYMLLTIALYLYFVKVAGPRLMIDRKPFRLRRVIQTYNVLQVALNVYFCVKLFHGAYVAAGYSFLCQGLYHTYDANTIALADDLYYYFIARVSDFLDTIFFVLKKKYNQVTLLHVLHHTLCILNGWQFMKFGVGGQPVLGVCLNAFIHVLMYSYYFLSSLGPSVQRHLWWKRYLTCAQIGQFFIMLGHTSIPMFVECGYPRVLIFLLVLQIFLVLMLFINFYVQNYIKRARMVGRQMTHSCCTDNNEEYLKGKVKPTEQICLDPKDCLNCSGELRQRS